MINVFSFIVEKKRHLHKFLGFLFIFLSHFAYSQHEFFQELVLEKKLIENEKWECIGEANLKYQINEAAWRRWGMSLAGVRKIKQLSILGGLNGYYTINEDITNFLEIRPWMALRFKSPVIAQITLRQQLKYEWRLFYTDEEPNEKENYGRLRYQIGFDIPISKTKDAPWKIRPYFEWFFIRNPADFERFSNERDFGIIAIKRLRNEDEFSIGLTREVYYDLGSEKQFGYLMMLAYNF